MLDTARITLVQLTSDGNPDSTLARMPQYFEQAAAFGSDLIVFPEYCLGSRISIGDGRVQSFLGLAKQHRMYAVAGLVELHGSRWATTALMVDRQGHLMGRYLKTHPASGPAPHYWPPLPGYDGDN